MISLEDRIAALEAQFDLLIKIVSDQQTAIKDLVRTAELISIKITNLASNDPKG